MNATLHATDRISSRTIPLAVVELALCEGEPLRHNKDRLLLGCRQLVELRHEGRVPEPLLRKAEHCGPIVVVVLNNLVITVFRVTRRVDRRR